MLGKIVSAFVVVIVALVVGQDYDKIKELRASLSSEIQLGIDLGTTQSVAAVCVQGNVSVVKVDGNYLTPSTVWFSSSDSKRTLVGNEAVAKRSSDPDNVVYAAKRVIGLEYDDPKKSLMLDGLPFDDVQHGRDVGFSLGNERVVTPEQVATLIVKKLKRASETSSRLDWFRRLMGFRFASLTVSIPVTFQEEQRSATVRACRKAGFKQVRLIEEPVAAALAYGLGSGSGAKRVLVYDIGGGTLDVALLYFNQHTGTFYVDTTAGEAKLGGEDFDVIVAKLVLSKIKDPVNRAAVETSHQAWQQLLVASERAKRELSDAQQVTVCVPDVATTHDPCKHRVNISRAEFVQAGKPTFDLALNAVETLLKDANLDRDTELDVVLVGGTSRVPEIRERISNYLPKSTLHFEGVDPDQAVAVGAARSWGCNQ
mmetsp:Transcript_10852/g.17775  ORF Transcript_10852/g.17775 Transcript_10852/m.17775 type:complete len:427 (-) Transcript_10852:38-1318(-)